MVLTETKKIAESVIQAFIGLDANILVQELIKESKGCDIRAVVIDGKVNEFIESPGAGTCTRGKG